MNHYQHTNVFQPESIHHSFKDQFSSTPTSYMPGVTEVVGGIERTYDIPSRLLKDRIVLLHGEFDMNQARAIVSQLLMLDALDKTKPIYLYINSPGGVIDDGLAILDTMKSISAPVHTIVNGLAASMGAFISAMGDERYATPNSRIMIHQPLGGARGQATDIQISAQQIQLLKEKLSKYLAHQTKKDVKVVMADMERDNWMTAQQAKDYGLIDDLMPYAKDFPIF